MKEFIFDITPVACPRMVYSDKWNKRPIVNKYFGFRNHLRYLANVKGLHGLPGTIDSIIFNIPIPASWNKKKKAEMIGQPHKVRPDLDNLLKAVLDGLCSEDKYVHSISQLSKIWSEEGSIIISIN